MRRLVAVRAGVAREWGVVGMLAVVAVVQVAVVAVARFVVCVVVVVLVFCGQIQMSLQQ